MDGALSFLGVMHRVASSAFDLLTETQTIAERIGDLHLQAPADLDCFRTGIAVALVCQLVLQGDDVLDAGKHC